MPNRFFEYETRTGDPILAGDTTLLPFGKVLRIQLPGLPGGLIWNRPISVLATTPDGQEQVIRIVDVTRLAQLAVFGAALLGSLLIWLLARNREQNRDIRQVLNPDRRKQHDR